MTSEPKSLTEKFVEDTQATYAYAYDKGGELGRWFGVSGIPHAVLLNPSGQIVWRGHPGNLTDADIVPALVNSFPEPLFSFAKEAKGVAKALRKNQWAKALGAAIELGESGSVLQASIKNLIAARLDSLEKAWKANNFLEAQRMGISAAKALKGLPEGERASEIIAELKGDKEKQKVLKVQELISKLMEKTPEKRKDFAKLIEKIEKLGERYPETVAQSDALSAVERLYDLKQKVRR